MEVVKTDIPSQPLIEESFYLDIEGPTKDVFRNGDSTWSKATAEELEAGLAWWKTMLAEGKA